jgi:hypothetical protein
MRISTFTVVAVLALAAVAIGGGAVAGETSSTDHDNGIGANYTVVLPDEEDHYPGTDGGAASIWHLAAGGDSFEQTSSPEGLERMDTLTIRNRDIVFASCTTENTAAFGLDYGNNNSGTETDEGLLSHRKESSFNEHSIYVNFYGPDSLAGSPVRFNAIDQVVAVQQDCYDMPDEPGWYQINARINGTGYNGNYIDTKDAGTIRSHYFYICECSSEQEAREKLGPPPSDDTSSGGSSGDSSTATPSPTPTPESDDSGSSGDSSTATPTDTATATATPTPESADSDSGGDSGGSSDDGADDRTATATATAASGGSGDDGGDGRSDGQTATATAASGDDQQVQQNQQGDGPATPTAGAGPGFGLVAALGGVLAAALLAHRRD